MSMEDGKYYVLGAGKTLTEGLTREQIYAAIAEATGETPTSVDDAFISKIQEGNRSRILRFWKGTRAQFNALATHDSATLYIIDDDTTISDFETSLSNLENDVEEISEQIAGIVDTDWASIYRETVAQETVAIGRYRIKSGIAFFEISYDVSNFSGGPADEDLFTVPVDLDLSLSDSSRGKIPFVVYDYDGGGYALGFATLNKEVVAEGSTNIEITAANSAQDIRQVELFFSYPVITEEN